LRCTADPSDPTSLPYCLFNLLDDPNEDGDLVLSDPATYLPKAEEMMVRLRALSADGPPGVCGDCTDGDAPSEEECAVVDDTGSWQPWE
jgi:hypothetical protein